MYQDTLLHMATKRLHLLSKIQSSGKFKSPKEPSLWGGKYFGRGKENCQVVRGGGRLGSTWPKRVSPGVSASQQPAVWWAAKWLPRPRSAVPPAFSATVYGGPARKYTFEQMKMFMKTGGLSQEHSEVLLNFTEFELCLLFSIIRSLSNHSPITLRKGPFLTHQTQWSYLWPHPIPCIILSDIVCCPLHLLLSTFSEFSKYSPVVEGPNLPCQRIQGLMNSLELVCPSFQHLLTRWNNHKARSCWIRLREPWQTLPLVRFPASLAFVRASKSKLVGKHSIAVSLFGWSKQILCQYRPSPDGKIQTTILILLLRRCPALSLDIAFHCYVSRTCSLAVLDQNWQGLISYQLSNVGGLALDPVQSVSYTCSFWVCCGATFICDVLGRISKLIRHSYQCGYWVSNFT